MDEEKTVCQYNEYPVISTSNAVGFDSKMEKKTAKKHTWASWTSQGEKSVVSYPVESLQMLDNHGITYWTE